MVPFLEKDLQVNFAFFVLKTILMEIILLINMLYFSCYTQFLWLKNIKQESGYVFKQSSHTGGNGSEEDCTKMVSKAPLN